MKKQILISKIIIGALAVSSGLLMMSMGTGGLQDFIEYGGDAYTGIQQAAAQTAYNVYALSMIVKCGFASVLGIIGGLLIVPSAIELAKINKDARKALIDNYMSSVQQQPLAPQVPTGTFQYASTGNANNTNMGQ